MPRSSSERSTASSSASSLMRIWYSCSWSSSCCQIFFLSTKTPRTADCSRWLHVTAWNHTNLALFDHTPTVARLHHRWSDWSIRIVFQCPFICHLLYLLTRKENGKRPNINYFTMSLYYVVPLSSFDFLFIFLTQCESTESGSCWSFSLNW